ncbi:MAG: hypothetical protein Q7T49_01265 [bacterium]|nr:hypothetical protein [bacterium]
MAFSLPLPTKKFWAFAVVVIILIIAVLWWLGDIDNGPTANLGEQIKTEETPLTEQLQNIQNLVTTKLAKDGSLAQFTTSNLPADYKNSQLKTVTLESREVIRAYAAAISESLSIYDNSRDNDVKLVLKAIDTNNSAALGALSISKLQYDKTIKDLATLKVPKSAAEIHLAIINSLQKMSSLLAPMQQALDEPTLALQASQEYLKANLQFAVYLQILNQYFQKQNLVFSEQEQVKINPTGQ